MTLLRAFGLLLLATFAMTAPAKAQSCDGGFSDNVRLGGQVENTKVYRLEDLKKLPASRVTVTYFSGAAGLVTKTYTGVPLYDLIQTAVVKLDPARKNDVLRKYVIARATDCYESLISVADMMPNFGAQQVLIAYADGDGLPLDETEGMARLIVPGDKQGGRLVSNLRTLFVRSALPN